MSHLIRPGTIFSTPFEKGCVAETAPDAEGSFDGIDSDGVPCSFWTGMVSVIVQQPEPRDWRPA